MQKGTEEEGGERNGQGSRGQKLRTDREKKKMKRNREREKERENATSAIMKLSNGICLVDRKSLIGERASPFF